MIGASQPIVADLIRRNKRSRTGRTPGARLSRLRVTGRHLSGGIEQAARYVSRSEELHERFLAWAPGVLAPIPIP